MAGRTRQGILKELVALAGPVHPLEDELRGSGWDSVADLVVLTAADVLSVLDRFTRDSAARWKALLGLPAPS